MRVWLILLVSISLLAACGSPRRPAPVEDRDAVEGRAAGESRYYGGYYNNSSGERKPAVRLAQASKPKVTKARTASSSTILSLLKTAKNQQASGNLTGAAATLERALRIEPRNAVVWSRLAKIRLAQKQYRRASSLATKSNSLAGNNTTLKRSNWLLIAQAKRAMGDAYGAQQAEQKASGIY